MTALNKQIDGSHYQKYKYQPVQYIMDTDLSYPIASAIKYLSRIGVEKDKNNIGIDKAIHYVELFQEYYQDKDCFKVITSEKLKEYTKEFTQQFPEPVSEIISDLVHLSTGLDWCYYDHHICTFPLVDLVLLEQCCKSVISNLNTIKE